MAFWGRQKEPGNAPEKPYVKIQRTEEHSYSLELVDPGDWMAFDFRKARSLGQAEKTAEDMLRQYARQKGYQQQSWIYRLEESR